LKPESKFWQEVKKNIKDISFTRLESWASFGVPDLLCYNKKHTFFTIELKVTTGKKLRFSPHQISFHIRHPHKTFILARVLGQRDPKLYEGAMIQELCAKQPGACTPVAEGWAKIQAHLVKVT
jgi:hypothetical protein